MIKLLLVLPALIVSACIFSEDDSKGSKTKDPQDTVVIIDTSTVDTVPDIDTTLDTTTAVPDTIIPGKDAVLHAPDSLKCFIGEARNLDTLVRIEPDTLHQSITFLVQDAGIARVSAKVLTCRKVGITPIWLQWANGYVTLKDTMWVVVMPSPE